MSRPGAFAVQSTYPAPLTASGTSAAAASAPAPAPGISNQIPARRGQQSEWRPFEKRRGAYHFISPVLRFLQLAASVCAFSVLVSASQSRLGYGSYAAFEYLIVGTVISAFWALTMLFIDGALLGMGRSARVATLKQTLLKFDFIVASLVLSAASAGAAITTFHDSGALPYPQEICSWPTPWGSFCARTKAAVAMAFIAFFFYLPSIALDIGTLGTEFFEQIAS